MDAIVVGAGPAGSTTAMRLAAEGREVVLLDRAHFPRPKVCGDGLTPRAIAGLEQLGVWQALSRDATIVTELRTQDLATGATVVAPLPSRVPGGPAFGAVVSRTVLDDTLRRAAVRAGVRFEANAHVRRIEPACGGRPVRLWIGLGRDETALEADVVVAADGASSRIAETAFGAKPGVVRGVAVRQYWRVPVARAFTICIPLRYGAEEIAGYGWVFPVGENVANVGVGVVGEAACSIRSLHGRFVERLRGESDVWAIAAPLGIVEGGPLAAGLRRDRVALGGLLFVGDAAGSVNPFSGEGIAQAIEGGLAAADAVVSSIGRDRRLGDAYWDRLVARFPHATRNVDYLSWLVDRGRTFTREFWYTASSESSIISRAARKLSLDEDPDAGQRLRSARAESAWRNVRVRFADARPLFSELLDAIRDEIAPSIDAMIGRLDLEMDAAEAAGGQVDVALTLIAIFMSVANDPDDRRIDAGGQAADDPARWATESSALAVADLVVAELFGVLAEVPARWARHIATAATQAVASRTRRVMTESDPASILQDLRTLAGSMAHCAAGPPPARRSIG